MKTALITIISILLCGSTVCSQAQSTQKEKIAKETMRYVGQGSAAYLEQDYQKAIQLYSKALELEKKEPTLEKNVWRVLVDNLGISYGISGDNKKAKEIFEYGLSRDDKYPMFYYNLACAYAEMNDLDDAIVNLKRAFQYKKNMIIGEHLPDPETDDSFSRYLKNEKFRRALEELNTKSEDDRIRFTVPAAPWTLTLPKGDLVVAQQQIKPDGRNGYFSMRDEKNQMTISFFIEPVKDCQDGKACRDMVWKLGNPSWENPQKVVQGEIGDVSYFEFFMPAFQGMPVKQQNMYAEFVKDGFWVDLHISKVLYKPEDHQLFERIIKSIRFEAKGFAVSETIMISSRGQPMLMRKSWAFF